MDEEIRARDNLAILANGIQLATAAITGCLGNDTSSTLNGEEITEAYVGDAVAARLKTLIAPYMGGV